MTDTHTHLYLEEFEDGGRHAVEAAKAAGVDRLIFPNVDLSTARPLLSLHESFPDFTFIAAGLHPTEVDSCWEKHLEDIMAIFSGKNLSAIGEVGMDLYWDKTYRKEQMECFATQLDMAAEMNLPVIIHCREALDETLDIAQQRGHGNRALIFHSFTGDIADAERILQIENAYIGINGVVTFKNASSLRDAVKAIPIERILLETDSPYLAPVPKRGKRNESAFLPFTAGAVATIKGVTPDELHHITDNNANKAFNLER